MMRKLLASIILMVSLGLIASCSGDGTPDGGFGPLVVEGWIDSDGHPYVQLTRSLVPGTKDGNLDEAIIRWGVVAISDGEQEVILTGKTDSRYFPPYIYTTTDIFGEPGQTYRLTASYKGQTVTAECKMPPVPVVDQLTFRISEGHDTLCSANLTLTAPADCPAYYHLASMVIGRDSCLHPAMLGSFRLDKPGEKAVVPVFRGFQLSDTTRFVPQWPLGSKMRLRVERVSREVFEFWQAYDNAVMFGSSQFVGSQQSLPSTIQGGYGVFSAQGAVMMMREVIPDD